MEKVTFSIPALWADHHVLAVRQLLGQVAGVEEVIASAMYKDVLIRYDPSTVTADALAGKLAEAGYEMAKAPSLAAYPKRIDDSSD
jgi:copper chaperone CopZ